MHILVTNDDGIQAPGLLALVQAVRPLGKISVVAPERNWSTAGHAKTLDRPLKIKEVCLGDGSSALSCDGTPSDCVALALMGLLEEPVDLVVSGVNPYPNLSDDMTYSGTVTNAMEAVIWGVPGIAFSLDGFRATGGKIIFDSVIGVARKVVEFSTRQGLTTEYVLNVNIPHLPEDQIKGFRVTRLGKRVYKDRLFRYQDPWGRPIFWIGGEEPTGTGDADTDVGALEDGYVSITPLQLDMTAHHALATLRNWNFS
jgi:5'-nucleotidase